MADSDQKIVVELKNREQIQLNLGDRFFLYNSFVWQRFSLFGPAIWNSPASEVCQTMNNAELFKKKLKTFYMQKPH